MWLSPEFLTLRKCCFLPHEPPTWIWFSWIWFECFTQTLHLSVPQFPQMPNTYDSGDSFHHKLVVRLNEWIWINRAVSGALRGSHKCYSLFIEWNPSTGPCLCKKGPFLGLPNLLAHSLTFIDFLGRDSHLSGLIDRGAGCETWAWGNLVIPCHSELWSCDREPCMRHGCNFSFQGSLWCSVGWE